MSKSVPPANSRRLQLSAEIHNRLTPGTEARNGVDALSRRFGELARAKNTKQPVVVGQLVLSDGDICDLAALLGVDPSKFAAHRAEIEYISREYVETTEAPGRRKARKLRETLTALRSACRNLADGVGSVRQHAQTVLDLLDIAAIEAADDGPGPDAETIKVALESAIEDDKLIEEDALRHAVRLIAQLANASFSAANAIDPATRKAIEQLSDAGERALSYQLAPNQKEIDAADEAGSVDANPHVRLAVRRTLRGHHSGPGLPLEALVAGLLRIYEQVVGSRPVIWWSDYTQKPEGKCIPFVQRALQPFGATITPYELAGIIKPHKYRRPRTPDTSPSQPTGVSDRTHTNKRD